MIAIVGVIYYTNQQNKQLDKEATRPVYPVDKTAIYNGLLLANSKGNPNRYDTYLYFPNEKQLLDNIPKCIEPVKSDATEYLKAYKKVYKYILKENLITNKNPQLVGKYSKQVLDFIYNYQSFKYFRDLYAVRDVRDYFNVSRSLGGTTLTEFDNYYSTGNHDSPLEITGATPESIANEVFSQSEQKQLAQAEGRLLNQVSNNCVQAGYGKDFYSIWWAGLASQGVSEERASQVGMMYDIFYKAYLVNMALDKIHSKQKREGKVWRIIQSKEAFIKEVFDELKYKPTNITHNVLNVLTAEILQDGFNNKNYSLLLRVSQLLMIEDYYNKKFISKNIRDSFIKQNENKKYFAYQSIGFYAMKYFLKRNKEILEEGIDNCHKYSGKLKYSQKEELIRSYNMAMKISALSVCKVISSNQAKQVQKFYF